jgi:flagellar hook-associated protein 2
MGSVGLTFGSATSGTGFDVASTVTSILAISQGIETPWKTQLTALTAQDTVLSTMGTDLSTLSTAVSALTAFDGVVSEKQGSSSNTEVLSLTAADPTSVAGSHNVTVTSLAATGSDYLDNISDSTALLSGTLKIGTATITVSAAKGNNTLATLATAINTAAAGVTASVITDANGSRLSLVSSTSGVAGQAVIDAMAANSSLSYTTTSTATPPVVSAPTALNFNTGATGVNAVLQVDGVGISSASNTVSGAIPGVTFQILSAGSNVQVQVTNDNSAIETAMQAFVTAYNTVNTDIKTQEGKDSSGNPEPLYGSATLALLQSQLQSALIGGAASGAVNSITQLGVSVNNDGSLTFDSSSLDSELNSNFSDVVGFLQNAGSFGQTFTTTLNNLGTQAPNGSIYLAQQQNVAEEADLNLSITNENALIATQKTTLTTELNTANQILQSIPTQLSEINEMYSAVTGYNNTNG